MKIALIEPIGGHGGMDYYDYGLAYGLGEDGHRVFYHTCKETRIRDLKNVTTHYSFGKLWNKNIVLRGLYFITGYLLSFLSAKETQCPIIHMHFFDLSKINKSVVKIASIFFDFKIVVTIHDIESLKGDSIANQKKSFFTLIDQIIVHNHFSKRELMARGADGDKITVIPHGNYKPFVEELAYDLPNSEPLHLLFFGQIKEVKGLEILLKALEKVIRKNQKVHLTIAGRPWHDDIGKYQEMIDSYNLTSFVDTRFKYIPNDEVAVYFSRADVVVLPYKKIYQSGVLLLAMSYGRPVLASNLEAFREIINHKKTGILFEPEDETDLSDKIIEISENPEMLQQIRNNASKLLKTKFDWKEIGKTTSSVYHNLFIKS